MNNNNELIIKYFDKNWDIITYETVVPIDNVNTAEKYIKDAISTLKKGERQGIVPDLLYLITFDWECKITSDFAFDFWEKK